MSDLIDREAVQREIQNSFDAGAFRWQDGQDLMDRINALPTVDAVPVVHGEWIIDGAYIYYLENDGKAYEPVYRCSCCNRQMESYVRLDEPEMPEDADFPEFCPHCGARMDGERREG